MKPPASTASTSARRRSANCTTRPTQATRPRSPSSNGWRASACRSRSTARTWRRVTAFSARRGRVEMPTQWYMGYDGVEYPIEVTAREEQPMSDWMHGNNQLYDLRLTVTAPNGDEIRVYDEYRWTSGRGGRYFIGYRLDDGRSQLQV